MGAEVSTQRAIKVLSGMVQAVMGLAIGTLPYVLAWLWFDEETQGSTQAVAIGRVLAFLLLILPTVAVTIVFQGIMTFILLRGGLEVAAVSIWLVYVPLVAILML